LIGWVIGGACAQNDVAAALAALPTRTLLRWCALLEVCPSFVPSCSYSIVGSVSPLSPLFLCCLTRTKSLII
jgi:hypothetical protein